MEVRGRIKKEPQFNVLPATNVPHRIRREPATPTKNIASNIYYTQKKITPTVEG